MFPFLRPQTISKMGITRRRITIGGERLALLICLVFLSVTRIWSVSPSDNIEFFEQRIRPILAEKCYLCHGPQLQQKGLRLDSREAILTGGSRGPAIVPHDVVNSLLVQAVRHEGLTMPPAGKLTDEQINAIEKWISLGAPWPTEIEQPLSPGDSKFYEQITKQHWAFQLVKKGLVEEKDLRIPSMRGIMTARTKPLEVIESNIEFEEQIKVISYDKPLERSKCNMMNEDEVKKLVELLNNEAKVI